MLFNKPITEKRFNEVKDNIEIYADGWFPKFNTAYDLKEKADNKEWKATPAYMIEAKTDKEAYADMPEKLREYIKSLPEYDEEVFLEITEGK